MVVNIYSFTALWFYVYTYICIYVFMDPHKYGSMVFGIYVNMYDQQTENNFLYNILC